MLRDGRGRRVELLMTGEALDRRAGELAAGVALDAGLSAMCTRQREGRQVVIERPSPAKGRDRVTLLTVCPESRRLMRRIGRCIIGAAVASDAVDRDVHVLLLLLVDVACLAWQRLVRSGEREACAVVTLCHVRHKPGLR